MLYAVSDLLLAWFPGENCDVVIRSSSLVAASEAGPSTAGVSAIVVSVLLMVAVVVVLVIVYYRRRLHRLKKELHTVVQYFPERKDPTGENCHHVLASLEGGNDFFF